MAATGFFEQKPASPLSFGAVLMLHGAVIAAVVLIKGPEFIRRDDGPIIVDSVPIKAPPPVEVPDQPVPKQSTITRYDIPEQLVRPPIPTTISTDPSPGPSTFDIGTERAAVEIPTPRPPEVERVVDIPPRRPPAVRVEAQFDPRFAGAMQPPYPATEVRAEREGSVRVRVAIAPSGRVTAVQQLSATSAAFFQATQRQALSRWRFRPATLDGRPIESSKVMTVTFRLDGR